MTFVLPVVSAVTWYGCFGYRVIVPQLWGIQKLEIEVHPVFPGNHNSLLDRQRVKVFDAGYLKHSVHRLTAVLPSAHSTCSRLFESLVAPLCFQGKGL